MLCLKKLSSRKELMMKLSTCCAALLLALASPAVLAAPGSCERIQSDISQRIINNGVPESSFTLSIVPNDQLISLIPVSSGIALMIRIKFSTPAPPAVTSLLPRSLPRWRACRTAVIHYRLHAGYDTSGDLNIQHNPTLLLIPFY